MQNAMAHGNWKRSLKKMASIALGVIIGQWISHPNDFTTWTVVWHTFRTVSITILFLELTYINAWLSSNGNGSGSGTDRGSGETISKNP